MISEKKLDYSDIIKKNNINQIKFSSQISESNKINLSKEFDINYSCEIDKSNWNYNKSSLFYGIYTNEDLKILKNHKAKIYIIWDSCNIKENILNYLDKIVIEKNFCLDEKTFYSLSKNLTNIEIIKDIKLTFVTTCFNRFWQLKQVYYNNVKLYNKNLNVKFILADFNGDDSDDIEKFIKRNFSIELITGKLKYFKRIEKWNSFNMSKAKNFVSSMVNANEYIYNLDGDNILIGDEYDIVNNIYKHNGDNIIIQMNDGPPNVKAKFLNRDLGIFSKEELIDDKDIIWNGTSGRLVFSKSIFNKFNGYPEIFQNLSMEELFFILNCVKTGIKYLHKNLSKSNLFINQVRDDDYDIYTKNNQMLFKEHLIKENFFINSIISEKRHFFNEFSNEKFLTCFTILFKVDQFINNFINDILSQSIFKSIYFKCYNFSETNSEETNFKINELKKFNNIQIIDINLSEDKGLYYYWNDAVKTCNTIFISSFNPDDIRGSMWAETLLKSIEPNIHIICGATVPFQKINLSYKDIVNSRSVWFKKYTGLDNNLNFVKKTAGDYLKIDDLFQIIEGKLLTHCIPNSSPIWDVEIHKKIGLFDSNKWNAETDFVMWLNALRNNFNIKFNSSYKVGFFISKNQFHKKQKSCLKKVINELSLDKYKNFLKKNIFNLSLVNGKFGNHHLYGWNWVCNEFTCNLINNNEGILIDLFVERTFHENWCKELIQTYKSPWMGIIHTTPNLNNDSNKMNYVDFLFDSKNFIDSLDKCKAIILLNITSKKYLSKKFNELNFNIPIFVIKHPYKLNFSDSIYNENKYLKEDILINHVGYHQRKFSSFIKLNYKHKQICTPKIWNEYDSSDFQNSFLKNLDLTDIIIKHLDDSQYIDMLKNEIVFVDFIDVAASNLICECIISNTPILINRLEQTEFYLGKNYPLFYDNLQHANELVKNKVNIINAYKYLYNLNKNELDVKIFINKLIDIAYTIS